MLTYKPINPVYQLTMMEAFLLTTEPTIKLDCIQCGRPIFIDDNKMECDIPSCMIMAELDLFTAGREPFGMPVIITAPKKETPVVQNRPSVSSTCKLPIGKVPVNTRRAEATIVPRVLRSSKRRLLRNERAAKELALKGEK